MTTLVFSYLFGHYHVSEIAFFGLVDSIISICKATTQQKFKSDRVVHFVAVANGILVVYETCFRVLLVHALRFRSLFEQLARERPGLGTSSTHEIKWAYTSFVSSLCKRWLVRSGSQVLDNSLDSPFDCSYRDKDTLASDKHSFQSCSQAISKVLLDPDLINTHFKHIK